MEAILAVLLVFFLGFGLGFAVRSYMSYRRRRRRRSNYFQIDDGRPALNLEQAAGKSPTADPVPLDHELQERRRGRS
jgi:hypothetical protein